MKRIILAAFTALMTLGSPAMADPVLQSSSGICHCPGGAYYDDVSKGSPFSDLASCLANNGREPKRGQGQCDRATAAATPSQPAASAQRPVASAGYTPKYDRDEFGAGWLDFDGNCMNTRHEMLRSTSTGNTILTRDGCAVARGRWLDPYTDTIFTDPKEMDMDHIVPLSFAWQHGAYAWSRDTREKFANDPVNLIAVDLSANRQKSDSGPLKWLPDNVDYRCEYTLRFMRISKSYDLVFGAQEAQDLTDLANFLCN